jgi:adenylate kinase
MADFVSGTKKPNILITGTPGTGKTTTSIETCERIGFKHVNVGDLVAAHGCHFGKDDDFDTLILDEDKICDILEPILEEGGIILDYHSCDFFPERWFDLILVLKSNTETLYDRLIARGYNDLKRQENMECEIMQIVLEQARESYNNDIIYELNSNNMEELNSNVDRIEVWYNNWLQQNNQS